MSEGTLHLLKPALQFIIQSLATTLLTTWMTRWSTPRSGKSFPAARLLPAASAAVVVLGLYNLLVHEDGQESRYYLSMILWWAAIPLTLLLWGTCQSWAVITREGQGKYYLLSILLSTVYLCCADVFALRRGTWHISVSCEGQALYYKSAVLTHP